MREPLNQKIIKGTPTWHCGRKFSVNTGFNHDHLRAVLFGFRIDFNPPPLLSASWLYVTHSVWAPSDLKVDQ